MRPHKLTTGGVGLVVRPLVLFVCILAPTLGLATSEESGPPVEMLAQVPLARLEAYCRSITSLDMTSTTTTYFGQAQRESLEIAAEEVSSTQHLVVKGEKYRADFATKHPNTGVPFSLSRAYDGETYQFLADTTLAVSKNPRDTNLYLGLNPLLAAFAFAFQKEGGFTLSQLQNESTWRALPESVLSAVASARLGDDGVEREGITLSLRAPAKCGDGQELVEVFTAADRGYLPLAIKIVQTDGTVSEWSISHTRVPAGEMGSIWFPSKVEWQAYDAKQQVIQYGQTEVEMEKLRVNCELEDSVFTISRSLAARYVDEDAGTTSKTK